MHVFTLETGGKTNKKAPVYRRSVSSPRYPIQSPVTLTGLSSSPLRLARKKKDETIL